MFVAFGYGGKKPVAVLANKHDLAETSTIGGASTNGCLTPENVCVALGVDAMQVSLLFACVGTRRQWDRRGEGGGTE